MKNIRPFGWVIIFLNFFYIVNFFVGREGLYIQEGDPDTVIFNQFILLVIWLVVMNIVLFVIYRVTGGKKRECPACGSRVKVGITTCSKCGFDFMKAAGNQ